ncbi:MAG TPA: DegT/DnrJ/EryC1/StrS family aminotransferase [Gemmataceae bacterium]|jgi:dTDP-4-amino-4,6-dideoxygalactose transaminase|nr:DegT/DnrJ/EryC1/StrS family aminotransferase [Gemmataceae bacterium]
MPSEPAAIASAALPITRPSFGREEVAAVEKVLDSGWVTQGPMTAEFERAFAGRHGVAHALATTSCTAALHMSVLALGIGPGDEVVVPAFTWVTSAHCAEYAGARAVFCDIDPTTFNLDPAALDAAVTPRTRAVIAVHLFGLAADLDAVRHTARCHGLAVVEDAACAVGSEYGGQPVGSLGDLGCFSFHPRKVITTGEGGMVTTQQDDLAERIAALRNHGARRQRAAVSAQPYHMGSFDFLGFNLRLSDIQSAIGLCQLAKLEALLQHRRSCARGYAERLKSLSWVRLPQEPPGYRHTYQSYVIWVRTEAPASRNKIMEHLAAQGVQTRPGTMAVHQTNYYRQKYALQPEQFPWAKAAEEQTITLPIFPGMQGADLDRVAAALRCVERLPASVRRTG